MSFASEFKEFAMKGNVIDLAVGVVIGAAFGKIVSSLVGDVVMPLLAPLIGSINFSDLAVKIASDGAGKPVLLKYGSFLQTCLEFLIIDFAIFIVVFGHILYALTHRESMRSMLKGWVSEGWAKRHAPGWLKEQKQ